MPAPRESKQKGKELLTSGSQSTWPSRPSLPRPCRKRSHRQVQAVSVLLPGMRLGQEGGRRAHSQVRDSLPSWHLQHGSDVPWLHPGARHRLLRPFLEQAEGGKQRPMLCAGQGLVTSPGHPVPHTLPAAAPGQGCSPARPGSQRWSGLGEGGQRHQQIHPLGFSFPSNRGTGASTAAKACSNASIGGGDLLQQGKVSG